MISNSVVYARSRLKRLGIFSQVFTERLTKNVLTQDHFKKKGNVSGTHEGFKKDFTLSVLDQTLHFKYLKGGNFEMGDDTGVLEERPCHRRNVDSFYISEVLVTFALYDRYCEQSGVEKPHDQGWGRDQRPVINISWSDAQRFIRWLNQTSQGHFRLPTEAEWEFAARAGSNTQFSWGDEPSAVYANGNEQWGWPRHDYQNQTSPVASFKPNPWGLFDMHGNVWEWCQDQWKKNYRTETKISEKRRALRGGSWSNGGHRYLRSAYRCGIHQEAAFVNVGLRLVRDIVTSQ